MGLEQAVKQDQETLVVRPFEGIRNDVRKNTTFRRKLEVAIDLDLRNVVCRSVVSMRVSGCVFVR